MPQARRGLGLELKERKKESGEGSDSDEEVKNSSSTSYIPPAGLKSKESLVESSQSRVCVNWEATFAGFLENYSQIGNVASPLFAPLLPKLMNVDPRPDWKAPCMNLEQDAEWDLASDCQMKLEPVKLACQRTRHIVTNLF